MNFKHFLTDQRHPLYLPNEAREDVARLVSTHQQTKTTAHNTPFHRQVDFWLLCLSVALANNVPSKEGPPSSWGYKFVDTKEVQLEDEVYDLLVVVGFEQLDRDPDKVDDPSLIIDSANRLVGAACPQVLSKLKSKEMRRTPLEKALALAGAAAARNGTES